MTSIQTENNDFICKVTVLHVLFSKTTFKIKYLLNHVIFYYFFLADKNTLSAYYNIFNTTSKNTIFRNFLSYFFSKAANGLYVIPSSSFEWIFWYSCAFSSSSLETTGERAIRCSSISTSSTIIFIVSPGL